ncbi:hypothetical protein V5J96_001573 [Enterobacter cloacae]|uniref:hypothetical protein n=1 Tax=Enterobacter cloacae TaxID=550 RepID=UPI0018C27C3E|nr:hypothetical protein [Enterobacter cloacae]MBG0521167.1 hypothetical protein [Enterobacter cloacae]MCU6250304.1 hypothetical protein [Enterobacter cloacae]HAS1169857.1 hypothetical protein [Enterobacter cloacae]HAS1959071.1 hypothetical protein [Enterobacter cloacae]
MKIDEQKLMLILNTFADVYPYFLPLEKFQELSNDVGGEAKFDGHLLYLKEKGLIISDMKWNFDQQAYELSVGETRISSFGLDYLAGM